MKVASLDLSTHAGYAILEGELGSRPSLLKAGTVDLQRPTAEYGPYPYTYRRAATALAGLLMETIGGFSPEVVVIEEINSGRSRYTQKYLENIHTAVLARLESDFPEARIVYLDSDGSIGWRTVLGLRLSKEQRRVNARLATAKRAARRQGEKLDKKKLGIAGKLNKKHLAVARANHEFGLQLIQKDNNTADALLLGLAFFLGATPCDGVA